MLVIQWYTGHFMHNQSLQILNILNIVYLIVVYHTIENIFINGKSPNIFKYVEFGIMFITKRNRNSRRNNEEPWKWLLLFICLI